MFRMRNNTCRPVAAMKTRAFTCTGLVLRRPTHHPLAREFVFRMRNNLAAVKGLLQQGYPDSQKGPSTVVTSR